MTGRLAIIAGRGALPGAVLAVLHDKPLVAAMEGFAPAGLAPDMIFRVERLVPFFRALQDEGVDRVLFAGAVTRPRLDPALFDPDTATLVPRLMAAMQAGDDATLRAVIRLFEEADLAVVGLKDVAPDLLPKAGILVGQPNDRDQADAERAAVIVAALGAVDVGQGAVVQQGLCLAVETLTGTDAMLAAVAAIPSGLRPAGAKGLFFKAAKPGQDRRIDLPTLGPATVQAVAAAGLGGIVWAGGDVICLDLPAMQAVAREKGLFLWAR